MGFKIADQLAEELGIASDAPERFRAGLIHSLFSYSIETGNTYIQAKDLLRYTIDLLESARPVELDPSTVAQELGHLIEEDKVQNVDTKIFDNSLFFAEEGIRSHIGRLLEKGKSTSFDPEKINQAIEAVEKDLGIRYDAIQKEAIHQAIQNKVFILTGGSWDRKDYRYQWDDQCLCPTPPAGSSEEKRPADPAGCPQRDEQLGA